jgi:hypothetical protein
MVAVDLDRTPDRSSRQGRAAINLLADIEASAPEAVHDNRKE